MDGLAARWPWQRDSWPREIVFVLAVTVLAVFGTYGESHPRQFGDKYVNGHPVPQAPLAAIAIVAAASLALFARRRYPVGTLCFDIVAVSTFSLLGYVNGAAMLVPAVALYAVTSTAGVRRAVLWSAITMVVLMGTIAARNPLGPFGGPFDSTPGLVVAALAAGLAVANRRAYVSSIQARADDAAQRRIDAERLRIARELHDVVAHTMATINVQAGAAMHVAAERPDAAVDALRVIRGVSKEGLRELRAILDVLRQPDDADTQFPAPGLDQVGTLVNSARQAGLPVTLTVTGQPRPVPAEVDLAAYRIVQESLTNTIRHAGPASATVSVGYTDHDLEIEIADNGLGSPTAESRRETPADGGPGPSAAAGGGHGLPGMRERAASVSGSLEAGPAPGGGFRVRARLPLGGHSPDGAPGHAPARILPDQAPARTPS